ncbi:MAG TPA: hypothetical protein VIJ14_06210 [Rhabdochlamydiaceae bacterium]
MSSNKISPREAAVMVLKKAEELYRASRLSKSDAEGHNPDAKADAALGEQVEQDVQQHEEDNTDPAHADPAQAQSETKGHIKLAKFMGRMEHKRSLKKTDGQSLGSAIGYPGSAPAPAAGSAPAPAASPAPMVKAESAFDKVKNRIKEKEGYSEKAAAATAAKIGRNELGEAEMARRSAAGRKK